ncbi:MAG: diguanylate cyclase [Sandaracinaceae bacterium]
MPDRSDPGRPTLPEAMDAVSLFGDADAAPVLVVLTGPQLGQRIVLEDASLMGRDPTCALMLTDPAVKWHHARVEPSGHGWLLTDLTGGEGRTEVNGTPIRAHALAPDDQVLVGHTVVRYDLHDPVERAYDEAVLERLYKDELTGLPSRRKFDLDLQSTLALAKQGPAPLAVMILDLDHLKKVNDTYGHAAGEHTIATVGRRLGEAMGDRGFVGRLGGDEFAAFVMAPPEYAMSVAEDLRKAVSDTPIPYEDASLHVAASIGVAFFPDHGDTELKLLRGADQALYAAKGRGGNRSVNWLG